MTISQRTGATSPSARPHVHVPAPGDDVLGTASACCPLPAGNAVHIDASELPDAPPDNRYEQETDE